MYVITFDENGNIEDYVKLTERDRIFCRIPKGIIHMDLPSRESIHLETTTGPFQSEDNVVACWFNECDRDNFLKEIKHRLAIK